MIRDPPAAVNGRQEGPDFYRIIPGGFTPDGWVVVPIVTSEECAPIAVACFGTKQNAQHEADRLNGMADNQRRDATLHRIQLKLNRLKRVVL